MDFIRKVKNQEEKDRLIAEAKKQWDALPASASHLVCSDEESYLSGIADLIEVEAPEYVKLRALTAAELAAQDGRVENDTETQRQIARSLAAA